MRLSFNPESMAISVRLRLNGGVAIDGPELWRMNTATYLREPGAKPDPIGADWTDLTRHEAGQPMILQLYWRAFAPTHARWRYPVTITVLDQKGGLLSGRDGHLNPIVIPCDLGGDVPNWGHHQQHISIC